MLDRDKFKEVDEEKSLGVEYFLKFIRPFFVKGVHNVFLYRLMQFLSLRRGALDINRWLAKYTLMRMRLTEAWMDLYDTTPGNAEDLATRLTALQQHCTAEQSEYPATQDERVKLLNEAEKEKHQEKFPFSDNLFTFDFYHCKSVEGGPTLAANFTFENARKD